ncbi:uncharacterized protein C1orf127 homolog [Hipposideros larvatus]
MKEGRSAAAEGGVIPPPHTPLFLSLLSCGIVCLNCVQPVVFPWIPPSKSNKDRPSPALDVSNRRINYVFMACIRLWKANYRLGIRIFQRGVKRLEQSDRYIMKCPVMMSRLGQETIYCRPVFIQTAWLLSLQGQLVASLEDVSQVGLHVDINKK